MMKPSRTRDERKNPVLYTPEMELRSQLEQQANEKKKQKIYDLIKEKQETLDHYANFKLPTGENDAELANFLEQKQKELNSLVKQVEAQYPDYTPQVKSVDPREVKRKETTNPVFYDNFFSKDESNQARYLSKGELEREKRLKLREEERMRRLAGIKESVYDSDKPSLQPLPEIRQSTQEKKVAQEGIVLPIYLKQQSKGIMDSFPSQGERKYEVSASMDDRKNDNYDSLPSIYKKETDKSSLREALFGNAQNKIPMQFPDLNEEKENTPMNRNQQNYRATPQREEFGEVYQAGDQKVNQINREENSRRSEQQQQQQQQQQQGGFFNQFGKNQGPMTDAEKKRRYREELDSIMQQKKAMNEEDPKKRAVDRAQSQREVDIFGNTKPLARLASAKIGKDSSLPALGGGVVKKEEQGFFPYQDKSVLDKEEKKKKYAEELMQEIQAKEKEKERQKLEKRAQSSQAQARKVENENVAAQYESEQRQQYENYDERRLNEPKRGNSMQVVNNPSKEDMINEELEKKKKYKELLDAQVQEKKRIQSANQRNIKDNFPREVEEKIERRERVQREEIPERVDLTPKDGGNKEGFGKEFYLHKAEDEEKQRAHQRNLQKQKMAEDLKKQMEEKEEAKKREKAKKAEEDLREKQRLDRELEEEKRKKEEETQKKLQEKKNIQAENATNSQPSKREVQEPEKIQNYWSNDERVQQQSKVYEREEEPEYQQQQQRQAYYEERANYHDRQKEDLGEHHPYLSKQDFYDSNNAANKKVAFDPTLFPQTHYYQNMPSHTGGGYGNMPPTHNPMGYNPYYGYQGYPGYPGYQAGGYFPGMDAGYPMQMPQTMGLYNGYTHYQLMQQIHEEKMKIEMLNVEEQEMLNQYEKKILEIKLEKQQFEKECDKIRKVLRGEIPLNQSILPEELEDQDPRTARLVNLKRSYLPVLQELKSAKASHFQNVSRLLAQSQQNLMDVKNLQSHAMMNQQQQQQQQQQPKGQFLNAPNFTGFGDTMQTQSAIEESAVFRQSLPASSNFQSNLDKDQLEQSYLKDLEAYHSQNPQKAQHLGAHSQKMNTNLLHLPQNNSNMFNFSASLPMMSEWKPVPEGAEKNLTASQYNQDEVLESQGKIRKTDFTPKDAFDATPQQNPRRSGFGIQQTSDFETADLMQRLQAESNLPVHRAAVKEQQLEDSYLKKNTVQDQKKRESVVEQSREQEKKDLSSPEKELSSPGKGVGLEGAELKFGERRSQKSLVLAGDEGEENQVEFDDFMESNRTMFEELNLNLFKTGQKGKKDEIVEKGAFEEDRKAFISKEGWNNPIVTQPSKGEMTSRNIGTPMSTGSGQGDRRYRAPKTIDPFARVKGSEVRGSLEQEKNLFGFKDENKEDKKKEAVQKSYAEVSKLSGFIMESAQKGYAGDNKLNSGYYQKDNLEAIEIEEDAGLNNDDEENEPYVEEDISAKNSDEEYKSEFEDDEEARETMRGSPPKKKQLVEKPVKTEKQGDQRSKVILDRLQRLLNDLDEDSVDQQGKNHKIKEVSEESDDFYQFGQSKESLKPTRLSKAHSNRYSQDEDY